MKLLRVLWLLPFLFVAGCGSSGPYEIIDLQEGPGMKTIYVEVPVGASESEMETWAREIEGRKKEDGKGFMINFYNGGRGAENMVGNYSEGTLYKTK